MSVPSILMISPHSTGDDAPPFTIFDSMGYLAGSYEAAGASVYFSEAIIILDLDRYSCVESRSFLGSIKKENPDTLIFALSPVYPEDIFPFDGIIPTCLGREFQIVRQLRKLFLVGVFTSEDLRDFVDSLKHQFPVVPQRYTGTK